MSKYSTALACSSVQKPAKPGLSGVALVVVKDTTTFELVCAAAGMGRNASGSNNNRVTLMRNTTKKSAIFTPESKSFLHFFEFQINLHKEKNMDRQALVTALGRFLASGWH